MTGLRLWVEERIKTLEDHVIVPPPIPLSVLDRLKKLEDRVLALEKGGNLPYQQLKSHQNIDKKRKLNHPQTKIQETNYSVEALDLEIETLKEKLELKIRERTVNSTLSNNNNNKDDNIQVI